MFEVDKIYNGTGLGTGLIYEIMPTYVDERDNIRVANVKIYISFSFEQKMSSYPKLDNLSLLFRDYIETSEGYVYFNTPNAIKMKMCYVPDRMEKIICLTNVYISYANNLDVVERLAAAKNFV